MLIITIFGIIAAKICKRLLLKSGINITTVALQILFISIISDSYTLSNRNNGVGMRIAYKNSSNGAFIIYADKKREAS